MGNPRNENINKSGQSPTKLTCQLKVIPIDHGSAAKYLQSTHGRLFIFDRGTSKYPPTFVFLSLKQSAKSQEVVSNQYFNTQNRIPSSRYRRRTVRETKNCLFNLGSLMSFIDLKVPS